MFEKQLQESFIKAIVSGEGSMSSQLENIQNLEVYQFSYRQRLISTMNESILERAAYLVGDELQLFLGQFFDLYPPDTLLLDQVLLGFSKFLRSKDLSFAPYLADFCDFSLKHWLLMKEADHYPSEALSLDLRLVEASDFIESQFPIFDLWCAFDQKETECRIPSISQNVLMFKNSPTSFHLQCYSDGIASIVHLLCEGLSLGQAIEQSECAQDPNSQQELENLVTGIAQNRGFF